MRPAQRTLAIVALTTTLVSCSSRAVPASTPTMPVEVPRIYATTATQPLLSDLLASYHVSSSADFVTNYQGRIEQLYQGEIAYFLTNHLPVDSPLWAAPLAQDGLAIIVSSDVNVRDLSLDQLRAIFQGRVTSWAGMGGGQQEIVVFSREEGSGTRAEFESMVMGYRNLTANARIAASSELMIQNIEKHPGAIGYVSLGYLDNRLTPVSIGGINPTWQTVTDATYPLRSMIYAVGLEEPQGAERAFLSWVQSSAGQAVVRQRYSPLAMPPQD